MFHRVFMQMEKMMRFVFALVLILLTGSAVARQSRPYRIIGYFAGWTIYEAEYFVTDIPADKLTHINYAFAMISDEGEIALRDEEADIRFAYPGDDPNSTELKGNFHQLQLLKEAHPHLQTLISVGGWTDSGKFSDAALTEESRQKFARSCVAFMLQYGFDGVDLDWEYPTGNGLAGNIERPEDAANFVLMLAELRSQLDAQGAQDGRHYLLTIALGSGKSAYEPLDWAQIHPLLDWINVMTYDMSGAWSAQTGFNAPLYNSSETPHELNSVDRALQDLLALGIPADKLVMGVPFYGRGWSGVDSTNNGLHQPFERPADGTWEPSGFDYWDLAEKYIPTWQRFWDENAQVPWLYNAETRTMISYDDAESLRLKANYVREHQLGGIMIWELSADDESGSLMTTIDDVLK
jgi:chitinase